VADDAASARPHAGWADTHPPLTPSARPALLRAALLERAASMIRLGGGRFDSTETPGLPRELVKGKPRLPPLRKSA
jgi:hypothetical protein